MKRSFLLIILICWLLPVLAQNPSSDALQWSLGQGTDLKTDQSFNYSGSLATGEGQIIVWRQKTISSTFSVASVSGTWTDISQKGQLVFSVMDEGASGTIVIGRDSKGLYATMEFPKGDPQGSKVRWKVVSVTSN